MPETVQRKAHPSKKEECAHKKTGAVGIEPTSKVLETSVLPLNYAPICRLLHGTSEIITIIPGKCNGDFLYFEIPSLFMKNPSKTGMHRKMIT